MKRATRSIRLVFAILLPLIALAVQLAIWRIINPYVWFLFFPAVFFSSWLGGRAVGLLSTVLSVTVVWWFFIPPAYTLAKGNPAYFFPAAVFAGTGILFSFFHGRLRKANRLAAEALNRVHAVNEEIKRLYEESQKARDALAENETKLKVFAALIDNSSDFIGIADANGKPVYVNSAGRRMVGLAPDHPVSDTQIPEYYPPELGAFVTDVIVKAMVEQGRWEGETFFRHWQTQEHIPVSDTHFLIREPETGRILGMGTITRDISAHKQADVKLRQAATVFDNTMEAILITDAQRKIVAVNPAYTKITGFEPETVLGKDPRQHQSGLHNQVFYRRLWESLEQTGQWQGEIWNRRKNGELYPAWENISVVKNDEGRITNYVAVMSDISPVKQAEARLSHLAHHDPLTDLPNRLAFAANLEQALERAKRHQQKVALLFLDLDRFKLINDTMGHEMGDQLLKVIAGRISDCVRGEDMAARLGGDEFTIILEGINLSEDAAVLAQKIICTVAEPVTLNGHEVVTSTSVGISIYPDDADNVGDLAKAADTAMYRAKNHGRAVYEFYTTELTAQALRRLSTENGLRQALARDEFVLYYQPQIDVTTGRVRGVEALLRWQHPELGLILPEQFIGVAEESGLIDIIGTWVLHQAFAQARRWRDDGMPPVRIAINISGHQIIHDHTVSTVQSLFEQYGLSSGSVLIEMEITESVLQFSEASINALRKLRRLGITIAIDDFGTGYSSLSQLKHLPIDTLKIDRAFLRNIPHDLDNTAITTAIISMGHSLGLKVIAEGVETMEQMEFLKEQGCDEVQGFLISAAVDPEHISAFLRCDEAAVYLQK